ncbi:hypothetical protein DNTS_015456, partial [Danionella cerebrum]
VNVVPPSQLQGAQAHLCSAAFAPHAGVLEPSGETEVTVSFTAHTVEELTEVTAVCEVEGMQNLLVLGFVSKPRSLRVSYTLPSDDVHSEDDGEKPISLNLSEHGPVFIGSFVTSQFLLNNRSAITAPFTVEAEYFTGFCPSQSFRQSKRIPGPLQAMQAKKRQQKAYEEFVSSLLSHGRGGTFFIEPNSGILGPFESRTINITAFTDMWGDYQDRLICKVGDLEPHYIPVKMCVRGCPVHFQMIGPQPENQNQGPTIRFGSHVSGGDTVSRSLRLVNSSPFDIRIDWVTYNLEEGDRKLLDLLVTCGEAFPQKDADGNEILGGLDSSVVFLPTWDESHTPSREGSSSTFMTQSDDFGENAECCDEEEDRGASVSQAPVKKLFSVFLRPHEGNLASQTPGKVERVQGYELKPLRLDMQANVKPATLSVQMADETEVVEFLAAASDILEETTQTQKESRLTRTFQLKNDTDMVLSFRLSTNPPFSVLLPRLISSSSAHKHTRGLSGPGEDQATLLLQPKHIMQIKVAFHNSASLLTCLNEACEGSDAQLPASLLCSDEGERTLHFQQSLTIQYSNNSIQTVSLHARLALPTLHLSSATVDFGTCYVGQTVVKEIYLYNRGGSCSYWTALTGKMS